MVESHVRSIARALLLAIGATTLTGCSVLAPLDPIELTAQNVAFDPLALQALAFTQIKIQILNADPPDISHTVEIRLLDGRTVVQTQDAVPGGTSEVYLFDPLQPGDYLFICNIHPIPSMTGSLQVR